MSMEKVLEKLAELQREIERLPAAPRPVMIAGKIQHPQGDEITKLKTELGVLQNKQGYNVKLAVSLRERLDTLSRAYSQATSTTLSPDEVLTMRAILIDTDDIQAAFRAVMQVRVGENYVNEIQQEGQGPEEGHDD